MPPKHIRFEVQPRARVEDGREMWVPKTEIDPTGRAPHDPGAKLDAGKVQPDLLRDFSLALTEIAKVCTYGATKYSRGGWQAVPDGITRYDAAAWRHMLAECRASHDPDSGLLHAAHEAWNKLARLELMLRAQPSRTTAGGHPGPTDATAAAGGLEQQPDAGKPAAVHLDSWRGFRE